MTLFDFHLHWYPGFQSDRLIRRIEDLSQKYTQLVGFVFDTERVDCWELFAQVWEKLPLSNRGKTDTCIWGDWESTGTRLVFYKGTQAISEENVELLILGEVPDTSSLKGMVREALTSGSRVILPWGFGKWKGGRGQLIREELSNPREGLAIADSCSRPNRGLGAKAISGIYNEFSTIEHLDGSDPLPMPLEEEQFFALGMEGSELLLPADVNEFTRWLQKESPKLKPVSSPPRSAAQSFRRQLRLRRAGFSLVPLEVPNEPGLSDRGDIESATDRYARRFSGEVGRYFLDTQAQITLQLAEELIQQPGEILDIGGGHAQISPHFYKKGWAVSLFASEEACRKRMDRILGSENFRFATGNLLKLPYPDNSFDVVTAFRLVTHETEWEELLEEAVRVSRGVVIVDYPDIRSFNALSRLLFLVKKAVEKDTREFALFNRRKIAGGFSKANASPVGWRPQFFFPMALYRMVGSGWLATRIEGVCRAVGLTRLFGSPVIVAVRKNTLN